jgi:hypothetical protein
MTAPAAASTTFSRGQLSMETRRIGVLADLHPARNRRGNCSW